MSDASVTSAPPSLARPGSRGTRRLSLMTAFIGGEEYALPLARVHEVAPAAGLTRVPTAPAFILGLIDLHGVAVPVIDLSRRFDALRPQDASQRSIVVVEVQIRAMPTPVGIAIDRLGRVLHVAPEQVQPPPALDSLISVEFLTGVFEGDAGFVLCVDVDRLLGADEAGQVAELSQQPLAKPAARTTLARVPYLCVRLSGERCALGLAQLHEITACGAMARIPGAAPFVLGATNVRGSIIPVVDVGQRYGLAPSHCGEGATLLVVEVAHSREAASVGMLVESIERLVQVPADQVNTTPPFGSRFPAEVVVGLVPVGEDFLPILDVDQVLADSHAPTRTAEASSEGAHE